MKIIIYVVTLSQYNISNVYSRVGFKVSARVVNEPNRTVTQQ